MPPLAILGLGLCASAAAVPPSPSPPPGAAPAVAAAPSAPGPYLVAVDESAAVGLFFTTFAQTSVSLSRRFWDRLELQLSVRLGEGPSLLDVESTLRAGVVLHAGRRLDVVLAWTIGWAGFRATFADGATTFTNAVVASVGAELQFPITRRWMVRAAPLVATGYWSGIWGLVLQPAVGAGYRF